MCMGPTVRHSRRLGVIAGTRLLFRIMHLAERLCEAAPCDGPSKQRTQDEMRDLARTKHKARSRERARVELL
jgi:hypothetical protein